MKSVQPKKNQYSGPVAILEDGKTKVIILGTAHVSPESIADVEKAIKELDPHTVCVELCRPRYDAMLDPDRWRKLNLIRVIREKKMGLLFSSLILSAYQKKLGSEKGIRPGQEMITAVQLAESSGRKLVLADRPVSITLTRAWRKVGFFSKYAIVSQLISSIFVREKVTSEELEQLKAEDALADLFKTLPPRYSSIKDVFISERDLYLAEKIKHAAKEAPGETILAVVGAGHLPGIRAALEAMQPVVLKDLEEVPPANPWTTAFTWLVFSALVGFVIWRMTGQSEQVFKEALAAWILGRSLGAGLGAILSLAHPLTVLVAALVAPFTIFLPGSRVWMFASITEVWLRKPHVEDFEDMTLVSESASGIFKALYKNRVLHLFWVIFLIQMGFLAGNIYIVTFFAKHL
ncbi:MAG TPA: TraB/GumN family protein [Leptospiraceae bacterium]|nr:TraB/GumN family protein [Leptospirales bacterium]HMW59212.1 TraB/GumN family protein [Leptospiraceae bacterium]HMX58540.1 TraB/GumN family protein [Leptospiraceae bacterium]HMY46021.1 TraB/GumN family protein [Leptospiraceae bacterium]HMZ37242.1 TraB/GumN family protein [Leptospiraceae bacterium]